MQFFSFCSHRWPSEGHKNIYDNADIISPCSRKIANDERNFSFVAKENVETVLLMKHKTSGIVSLYRGHDVFMRSRALGRSEFDLKERRYVTCTIQGCANHSHFIRLKINHRSRRPSWCGVQGCARATNQGNHIDDVSSEFSHSFSLTFRGTRFYAINRSTGWFVRHRPHFIRL